MSDTAAQWIEELTQLLPGKVDTTQVTRQRYARDASVFVELPAVVVYPETKEDIEKLVEFVTSHKPENRNLSLTARAAGTDLTGGPLTDSILVSFTERMNHLETIDATSAVVEPGMWYRDFEKATLEHGLLLPSYPASKNICAMGGIVGNNAAGEKTLKYGQTKEYVQELWVVFSDGKEYHVTPFTGEALQRKLTLQTFEGAVYRGVHDLVTNHAAVIQSSRPKVSKNSGGYNLWDTWDGKTLDLTKLLVGSQGTLGIVTKVKFRLVKVQHFQKLVVGFLSSFDPIPPLVETVLGFKPVSFESFDRYTWDLAIKYAEGFAPLLHTSPLGSRMAFLPEWWRTKTRGAPTLVFLAEFEGEEQSEVEQLARTAMISLQQIAGVEVKLVGEGERQKYWAIRRESFNLLRQRVKDLVAAAFIEDIIVNPDKLAEFLPKLYAVLDEAGMTYTVAGHIGNGHFHIYPLMDLHQESERKKIFEVGEKVFDLVLQYGGLISAEHNDGLVRSPFEQQVYGKDMYDLFVQVKQLFDPQGIFNPHKKVGASEAFAERLIRKE